MVWGRSALAWGRSLPWSGGGLPWPGGGLPWPGGGLPWPGPRYVPSHLFISRSASSRCCSVFLNTTNATSEWAIPPSKSGIRFTGARELCQFNSNASLIRGFQSSFSTGPWEPKFQTRKPQLTCAGPGILTCPSGVCTKPDGSQFWGFANVRLAVPFRIHLIATVFFTGHDNLRFISIIDHYDRSCFPCTPHQFQP